VTLPATSRPALRLPRFSAVALALALPLLLSACAGLMNKPATNTPSVTDAMAKPAERQLVAALRLYDDAMYREAEKALDEALRLKLSNPRDQATAWKTLAFIYCTSGRKPECEKAFRSARSADPEFALSKAEAGHPVWGPVYAASRR
jgi:Tfp pilus assembly protein PilF